MEFALIQVPKSRLRKISSVKKKLDSVELLRGISMIGVIWFHIENAPYKFIGHSGLVAFVMICTIFQSNSSENEPITPYLLRRLKRIAPPWLAWFVIYALLNLILNKKPIIWSAGLLENILTGPWIGLWFLPYIWAMSPIVYVLTRVISILATDQSVIVMLSISAILITYAAWILAIGPPSQPWSQWIHASPAIPLALAIKQSTNKNTSCSRLKPSVVVSIWLVICILLLWVNSSIAITYSIGAIIVAIAFTSTVSIPRFITKPGDLCLGVYLMHPIILGILKTIPIFKEHPLIMLIGTMMISFGLIHQMRSIPLLRSII